MLHDYTSLDNFWKRYNKVMYSLKQLPVVLSNIVSTICKTLKDSLMDHLITSFSSYLYLLVLQVLLEKLAIDKEKGKLVAENQRLKAILKQYLDGVSVNDEILSKANPLFVVNSHSNIP